MPHEYREVKCPQCGHVFMWQEESRRLQQAWRYGLKATGEPVDDAVCPGCGTKMIVLKGSFVGVDIDDERFMRIGFREI